MRIRKTIYWTSLVLIILSVVVSFVGQFTPLEFTNDNLQTSLEEIRLFGLADE